MSEPRILQKDTPPAASFSEHDDIESGGAPGKAALKRPCPPGSPATAPRSYSCACGGPLDGTCVGCGSTCCVSCACSQECGCDPIAHAEMLQRVKLEAQAERELNDSVLLLLADCTIPEGCTTEAPPDGSEESLVTPEITDLFAEEDRT